MVSSVLTLRREDTLGNEPGRGYRWRTIAPARPASSANPASVDPGAVGKPLAEERALLGGHLGEVADRHRLGRDRLLMDAARRRLDLLRRVEQEAARRLLEAGEGRLLRMADHAPLLQDRLDLREGGGLRRRRGRAGRGRLRRDRDRE